MSVCSGHHGLMISNRHRKDTWETSGYLQTKQYDQNRPRIKEETKGACGAVSAMSGDGSATREDGRPAAKAGGRGLGTAQQCWRRRRVWIPDISAHLHKLGKEEQMKPD